MREKNIIIAGAGFAGEAALKRLCGHKTILGGKYKIVVVNKNAYGEFLPMLPDIVGGWMHPDLLRHSVKRIAEKKEAEFIEDSIIKANLAKKNILLGSGEYIDFEYLLLSTGAEPNFHGDKDLNRNCLVLYNINDALSIRNLILKLSERKTRFNIVIIGGGYTGVEIATNIKRLLAACDCKYTIYLVEKAVEILPGLPYGIRHAVEREMRNLGIKILTGDSLKSYDCNKATLRLNGKIENALCIWTAGVKTPDFVGYIDVGKINTRIKVDNFLRVKEPFYPNIFVAGDSACLHDISTRLPLRMSVMFSLSQGMLAADNIARSIMGCRLKKYRTVDLGYLIPMAHGKAEGLVFGQFVHGLPAYLMHYFMCVYRSEWKNKAGIISDLARKFLWDNILPYYRKKRRK